jgi:hypothetical protein
VDFGSSISYSNEFKSVKSDGLSLADNHCLGIDLAFKNYSQEAILPSPQSFITTINKAI